MGHIQPGERKLSTLPGVAKQLFFGITIAVVGVSYPVQQAALADYEPALDSAHSQSTTSQAALKTLPALVLPKKNTGKKVVAEFRPTLEAKAGDARVLRITAYTSSPEETDDTPFITAAGTVTRDGIVATNLLPLGTKVMIPSLFGEKVFVVEDRMHPRMTNGMDIWMDNKADALNFGVRYAEIAVLK